MVILGLDLRARARRYDLEVIGIPLEYCSEQDSFFCEGLTEVIARLARHLARGLLTHTPRIEERKRRVALGVAHRAKGFRWPSSASMLVFVALAALDVL
jgi:hypothetical protein